MRFLLTNLKHFFGTLIVLSLIVLGVAIYFGADIDYGDNMMAYKVGDEGPHIFFEGEHLVARHIRGNRDQGFYVEEKKLSRPDPIDQHRAFSARRQPI